MDSSFEVKRSQVRISGRGEGVRLNEADLHGLHTLALKPKFSEAFDKQNTIAQTAIKSLDTLNDQIVQYIFAQHDVDVELESALSPGEQETLRSSMVLIRSLLNQAQAKFRKMVEDNKKLAARIDASIQAANQEVTSLRAELADTNKRLSEISVRAMTEERATQTDTETGWSRDKADEENELVKLREENSRLEVSIKTLTRELEDAHKAKVKSSSLGQTPSYGELKLELIQTRQELNRAKDALQAMKSDRKRLKSEKLDLLSQMKQLYSTLEEKEADLRDFIHNYEQRVKESDESIKQLASEKEDSEREKWEIIKKAREAAERAVLLRAQLDSSEQRIRQLEAQVRGRDTDPSTPTTGLGSSDTLVGEDEGVPPTSTPSPQSAEHQLQSEGITPSSPTPISTSTPSSVPTLAPVPPSSSSTLDSTPRSSASRESTPSTASMDRTDPMTPLLRWFNSEMQEADNKNKMKKKRSFGSLPKLFSRGRSRRSIAVPNADSIEEGGGAGKLTLLSPDNYQEKLASVQALKDTPMAQWKAGQVLAWLEICLSMPMYARHCALNIKSGKVLLGLSDSELGSALAITNPLHRRKLRLAIEEQRSPSEVRFPKAGHMEHTWVALCWLPDLGLPQYSSAFERHLVDGRLLESLTKKDLEKHLEVHRRFHQASILHSIHLLRRLNFDKEVLVERRSQCEDSDTDPLVWSNSRVMKWIRSIDLEEYAGNLAESGVNGAVMVLEPSFTADTLATALAIPPAKSYIRRHLASELQTLIKPARQALDTPNNNSKGSSSSSSSLSRSYRSLSTSDETPKRLSFRGSLGRAFGRKIRDDLRMAFDNDSSPRRKISAPIPIQHNRSLDSIVEPHHESTPV